MTRFEIQALGVCAVVGPGIATLVAVMRLKKSHAGLFALSAFIVGWILLILFVDAAETLSQKELMYPKQPRIQAIMEGVEIGWVLSGGSVLIGGIVGVCLAFVVRYLARNTEKNSDQIG